MPGIDDKKIDQALLEITEASNLIWIKVSDAADLIWEDNLKRHDIGGIIQSLKKYGYQDKARFDETLGAIKHGNGRTYALHAMEKSGDYDPPRGVAVIKDTGEWAFQLDVGVDAASENEAIAYALDANNLTLLGGDLTLTEILSTWDDGVIDQMNELGEQGEFTVSINADDLDALNAASEVDWDEQIEEAKGTLARDFVVPPFTVLDTRLGYWLERQRAWRKMGVMGEQGRPGEDMSGDGLTFAISAQSPAIYRLRNEMREELGRDPEWEAIIKEAKKRGLYFNIGTSVFDPVLAELGYRWFCPPGGLAINPTAGESVYGLVASYLGYRYIGVELREEQVEANRSQNDLLGLDAEWVVGNGTDTYDLVGEDADFIMCCPPYHDLEQYSDRPDDLSNMDYPEFIETYRIIIHESARRLKDHRFAFFVVADVRDADGIYRGFVEDTILAFREIGMKLFNRAVLINQANSAATRARRQFTGGRKLVKTHQNVLVFLKGDEEPAIEALGDIDLQLPEGFEEALEGEDD